MANTLKQLKKLTTVVADTGNFEGNHFFVYCYHVRLDVTLQQLTKVCKKSSNKQVL